MIIHGGCIQCFRKAAGPEKKIPENFSLIIPGIMNDDGVALLKCPRGHKTAMASGKRKYQLLFESGIMALIDGYTSQAVFSFYAALERHYEFYIRVLCDKHGLSKETIAENWKCVRRQSERQLGAFRYLFSIETNVAYPSTEEVAKMRNKVIHLGYIPSEDSAREFGNNIFDLVTFTTNKIILSAGTFVAKEDKKRTAKRKSSMDQMAIVEGSDALLIGPESFDNSSFNDFDSWYKWFDNSLRAYRELSPKKPTFLHE